MTVQDENAAVLRGWFEGKVWGTDDHEAAEAYIDAHYSPDGKAHGIGGEFEQGPASFKAFRRAMVAAFPTQAFSVTHLHAHEDMVWVRWEAKLTTKGGDEHMLVGGGPLEMIEGRITKAWNLVNFLELLEDAGTITAGALTRGFEEIAKR